MEQLTGRNLNISIFISGRGSNLLSLIKYSKIKKSKIKINLIISNNKFSKGLEFAKKNKIKYHVINYSKKKQAENKILRYLRKNKIDLFLVLSTLFLYIDNQKSLIVLGISSLFYFLFISKKQYNQSFFAYLLTFMVLTDLFIPFLNTNTQNKLEIKLNNCEDNLVSEYCLLEYEQLND